MVQHLAHSRQKWSTAGLRARPNSLRGLLLDATTSYLQRK